MIYIWVGPSGSNVKLGMVTHGEIVDVPARFTEHFKSNKLIEEIVVQDEIFKELKEEE